MSTCPTPKDYSQKVWCFQCGNEYFPEVTECIECKVSTTPTKPPDVQALGKPGEEHLAYDFHEWTGESRSMMESLLNTSKILHTWQGATLVVKEADEDQVDGLVTKVDLVQRPRLDRDKDLVEYDLEDFTDPQVTYLTQTLEDVKVPYEISTEGDLLIQAEDEEKVETLFDGLEKSEEDSFGPGVENADVPSVLSELHRLSSKLAAGEDLTNTDIIEGNNALETIILLKLPFGFSKQDWREIVERADDLEGEIEEAMEGNTSPELQLAASRLKEVLAIYG